MIPDLYTDPKFYDKKIQDINESLTYLGWIETIYPMTQIGIDDEGTFPECYKNDGTNTSIRVFPSGQSISFFTLEGDITNIDETDYYQVDLGLTIWADLRKVYPAYDYNYTTKLLLDVKNVLKNHGEDVENIKFSGVFSEYSQLEKIENQNVMLPYTAFKIIFSTNLRMC